MINYDLFKENWKILLIQFGRTPYIEILVRSENVKLQC